MGIPSAPYVRAKCYHYPLSSNDPSVYLMGLVISVTVVSGHWTKVKWEEVEEVCACVFACVYCVSNPAVSLQIKCGGSQVHVDIRRCKQANAL